MHVKPIKANQIERTLNKKGMRDLGLFLAQEATVKRFNNDLEQVARFVATEFAMSLSMQGCMTNMSNYRTELNVFAIKFSSMLNEVTPFDHDGFINQFVDVLQCRMNMISPNPNLQEIYSVISKYYQVLNINMDAGTFEYIKEFRMILASATVMRDLYHLFNFDTQVV